MSAYVALCHDDRVELLTDGAQYDSAGRMHAFAEKVTRIENVPAAITTRGAIEPARKLTALMEQAFAVAGSFDDTMEALAAQLPQLRAYEDVKGRAGIDGGDVEMIIAGISETRGPIVCFWSTRKDFAEGKDLEAYRLYETRTGIGQSHVLRPEHHARFVSRGGLTAIGVELMEAMRHEAHDTEDGARFVIGGHIDLTTITAEGATTRRLHTWPDRLGETINPFGPDTNIVPMNRRQRRAAARQHKRSA